MCFQKQSRFPRESISNYTVKRTDQKRNKNRKKEISTTLEYSIVSEYSVIVSTFPYVHYCIYWSTKIKNSRSEYSVIIENSNAVEISE